jgi:predicted nucleotidyltransferase
MAKASTATSLASDLAALAAQGLLRGVVEVHLFGSALVRDEPNDIDLLVVWDRAAISSADALALRQVIRAGVGVDLRIDITLLTAVEQASSGFPQQGGSVPLYRRDR